MFVFGLFSLLMLFHAVPKRLCAHKIFKLKLLTTILDDAYRSVYLLGPQLLLARSLFEVA